VSAEPNGRPGWLVPGSIFLAVTVAGLWATQDGLRDLIGRIARDQDAGAALLAPVVAVWLLYQRRDRLSAMLPAPPRSSLAAIPLGAATIAFAWWGGETDTRVASQLAAVATLAVAAVAALGTPALTRLAAVWGAVLLTVPLPGQVRSAMGRPLQEWGATASAAILEPFGIGIERLGANLLVDGTPVAVGEACDGMRMVVALAVVVYAYVFGNRIAAPVRILLLLSAPLVALACNILRLPPTVLGYAWLGEAEADLLHDALGWGMLPVCLGLNALLRAGFERVLPQRLVATGKSRPAPRAVANLPAGLAAGVASVAIFAAGRPLVAEPPPDPAVAAHRARIAETVAALPPRFGPWIGTDVPVPSGAQRILTPNALICRDVRTLEGDGRATFILVHCADVRDMLGHWPPVCYRADGWERKEEIPREIEIAGAGRPTLKALRHRFARFREEGLSERIEVWTAFLAPRSEPTGDLDAFRARAGRRGTSSLGLAQLQVVVPSEVEESRREELVRAIFSDLPDRVLEALAADPMADGHPES
jgi:exosortase